MMAVRNEAACDDVFIFPVDVFPETHGNGGKTKNPPEIPAGFRENGLINDLVQKTRRGTMKCHATRFSAAAAVIGLTGFANISARCCGNFRSGSIYLLHALAKSPNHLLPLSEMVASDRCKE